MATARATSLIVPSALDAAPIASSLVRWSARQRSRSFQSSSPVSGIIRTWRMATPRSRSRAPPGIDVGVMIELGHHDRVVGPEPPPQGPCQMKRQRGHVVAECDLRVARR